MRLVRVGLFLYWVTLAVTTHWPRLDLHVAGRSAGAINLDKPIHMLAFGVLTLLIMAARPALRPRTGWLWGAVLAALYAYADEITQQFCERTSSPADVLSNLVGILAAAALWGWWATPASTDAQVLPRRTVWSRFALLALLPAGMWAALSFGGIDWSWWLPMGPHHADRFELRADYVQHLLAALVGVLLLIGCRIAGGRRPALGAGLSILLMVLVGPAVEIAQLLTERGKEWMDVVSHEMGVIIGVTLWWGWSAARPRQRADTPSAAPAAPKTKRPDFVRHARTVGGLTLLSRFTGLIRDSTLAALFGLGGVADAFFIGFLVPNLFRRLFGEGALTAAFIPIYTELRADDPKLAQRFASACLGLLLIGLGVLVLIGEAVLAGLLALHPWSEVTALALRLTMLMLPYMPLVCLVAIIGAILQVHGRFAPGAAAPIQLNLVMLAGAAVAIGRMDEVASAYVLGAAVVAAGLVQVLWQGAILWRHERFVTRFAGVATPMRSLAKTMLPMLLGLAVFQINTSIDAMIAFFLSTRDGVEHFFLFHTRVDYPLDAGAVAALNWAQRLYQFPLGVFGIAVATAIFPALASAAAKRRDDGGSDLAETLRHGLRLTVFIGLPASVGLILVRVPLSRLIYQYGKFTVDDAQRVATILAGYAFAIWAYSMLHVLTRAFYAVKDPKTPLRLTLASVGLNLSLNVVLIWFMGAAGLAWSTAISAMWQCLLLSRAVRAYVHQPVDGSVWASWGRTTLLSLAMAGAVLLLSAWWDLSTLSRRDSALLVAGMVLVGGGVFAALALLLRMEEVGWLLRRQAKQTG